MAKRQRGRTNSRPLTCAITPRDLDDEIVWLRRANQAEPEVQVSLATSLAAQNVRDGKREQAIGHLREAISIYDAQVETVATLNNAAIIHSSLFDLTGETASLDSARAKLEKAHAILPADGIVMLNAADAILEVALRHLIGDAVDFKSLKKGGSVELLSYLYCDNKGRQAYIEKVRNDPDVAKAIQYYEKGLVLAPKRVSAYRTLASTYKFTHDAAALGNLERQIQAANPDLSDGTRAIHRYYDGTDDDNRRKDNESAIARCQAALAAVKDGGGVTLAIAAAELASQLMAARMYGREADAGRILELADRAHAAAPSAHTRSVLVSALCFRASQALAEKDEAYRKMLSRAQRSLGHSYVLVLALLEDGRLREVVLANSDVRRVIALVAESAATFPEDCGTWDWAMLRNSQPKSANKVAEIIKRNEVSKVASRIQLQLSPAEAAPYLHAYLAAQMISDAAAAKRILRQCASQHIPLPFEVK